MEDTLERWRSEKAAAYLSRAVASNEPDPTRAKLFADMAAAAEQQAAILAKGLSVTPDFAPSVRFRIIAALLRVFRPRTMRHALSASKVRGVSVYRSAPPPSPGKAEPGDKGKDGHPWPTSVEEIFTASRSKPGMAGNSSGRKDSWIRLAICNSSLSLCCSIASS